MPGAGRIDSFFKPKKDGGGAAPKKDGGGAAPKKAKRTVVEDDDEEAAVSPVKKKEKVVEALAAKQGAETAAEEESPSLGCKENLAGGTRAAPSPQASEPDLGREAPHRLPPQHPDAHQYAPEGDWPGGAVPYSFVASTLDAVEATTKRLEIQRLTCTALGRVMRGAPGDLEAVLFLLCGKVAPAYENLELGVGDSLLQKAIANAFGRDARKVKEDYEAAGDLGAVAAAARAKQRTLGFGAKPAPLTVRGVWGHFRDLAKIEGSKSATLKTSKIQRLIVAASPNEAKYIIRGLQGKLRVGLAESTVIVSLAQAAAALVVERKPPCADGGEDCHLEAARRLRDESTLAEEVRLELAVECVRAAYAESPSYGAVARAVLAKPLWAVHGACSLKVGTPVYPMLAKPTKSVDEVLKRLEGVALTCEHKYDGERVQCHLFESGKARVFSRNLQDTTQKWPELQGVLREAAAARGVKTAILDAEIVAVDRASGDLLPFQRLSTRKKQEDDPDKVTVPVIVEAFDLLYLNGQSLIRLPLEERRRLLRLNFTTSENRFGFAASADVEAAEDPFLAAEQIQVALEAAVAAKSEGLMIKTLGDTYEPSRRSLNWLKLKKDYLSSAGDSLDLVVVAAYPGKGKRTGHFGAYLLGARDADSGDLQTVCKLGTGFSDEDLADFDAQCRPLVIPAKPRNVLAGDDLAKDAVWIEPELVWEVRFADLSLSNVHKGALDRVEAGRGIGLRFPRLVRARPDKDKDCASDSDQVLEMYLNQESVKGAANGPGDDDDDMDGYL